MLKTLEIGQGVVGHALDPLNHLNGWGGGGSKVQFKASWVRAMGGGVWACTEAKQCKNTPIQGVMSSML